MNLTIFGMCVVDTCRAWSETTGIKCTQSAFYSGLAEELIHNAVGPSTLGWLKNLLIMLLDLVHHLAHNDRVVCGDCCFAAVGAALL